MSQCDTEHELSEVESIQFPKPTTLRTGSMTSFLDPLPNGEVYSPNNHKSLNISMSFHPIQTNEAPKESTQCALRDDIRMTLWHLKPLHHHCNMDPKISTCPVERHRPFNISAGNGLIGTNEMPKESLEWFLRGCAIMISMPFKPVNHHCQPIYSSPFSSLAINSSLHHVKPEPLSLGVCMKYVGSLHSLFSCDPTSLWYMRVQ